MKLLFDNSDQHISGDGAPDLRLHRILAVADKPLDAQMLLDPLEEQLDLPAALVKCSNAQRRQGGIVGQKHQGLAGFRVFEADAPQLFRIVLRDVETIQRNALVADDSRAPVGRHRIHPVCVHAALGAGHEERSRLVECEQPTEVQIAAIHHIERTGFDGQPVQHVDIAHLAVGNMDESRNVSAQIQQGMQLDRRLGRTKRRPWKQRQAQIYGRRVQGIDRVGEIDSETLLAIQLARTPNKHRRQVFPYVPVATLVGIGQRRTFDWLAKAHPVQLFLVGKQTDFDVAQTLAVRQLCEGHGAELFGTAQAAHTGIATIASHDARKARPRHKLHELREQRLAQIHSSPPEKSISGGYSHRNVGKLISNRHQIFCSETRINTGFHAVNTQFNRTPVMEHGE